MEPCLDSASALKKVFPSLLGLQSAGSHQMLPTPGIALCKKESPYLRVTLLSWKQLAFNDRLKRGCKSMPQLEKLKTIPTSDLSVVPAGASVKLSWKPGFFLCPYFLPPLLPQAVIVRVAPNKLPAQESPPQNLLPKKPIFNSINKRVKD